MQFQEDRLLACRPAGEAACGFIRCGPICRKFREHLPRNANRALIGANLAGKFTGFVRNNGAHDDEVSGAVFVNGGARADTATKMGRGYISQWHGTVSQIGFSSARDGNVLPPRELTPAHSLVHAIPRRCYI